MKTVVFIWFWYDCSGSKSLVDYDFAERVYDLRTFDMFACD